MQIISADERLCEPRGAKTLLVGPPGVGKTSLLRTVKLPESLFLDIDAGDLSVLDLGVDTIRLDDWQTARDVAVQVAGPNKSFHQPCLTPKPTSRPSAALCKSLISTN
jgi:ABC-type arginine transport system ATPase subunit